MSIIKAILAAALFGASAPLSKALLKDIHPFLLAGFFYAGAALILLPGCVAIRIREPITMLTMGDFLNLLSSLVSGGFIAPVLLLYGLKYTDAATASLLLNIETPATFVIAYFFFSENIGKKTAIACISITVAGVILCLEGSLSFSSGGLLIILACVFWGLDNNNTASIHSIDPAVCTFLKGVVFGSVNICIGLILSDLPGMKVIVSAISVGIFSYGISIVLYISSARNLGAARSQLYFSSAPFFGVLISFIYLNESVFWYQVVSIIIIIFALVLLFTEKHSHSHAHMPVVHNHSHSHDDNHHNHKHTDQACNSHTHEHSHEHQNHSHDHFPDLHHRHGH